MSMIAAGRIMQIVLFASAGAAPLASSIFLRSSTLSVTKKHYVIPMFAAREDYPDHFACEVGAAIPQPPASSNACH